MKRIAAVIALATAATAVSAVAATPAQAASVCISYDISVNGQGQAGSHCLPG